MVPIVKYPNVVSYLGAEATAITASSFSAYASKAQWEAARPAIRRKFLHMIGLDPLPLRTPLNARILSVVDNPAYSFTVAKLVFEASPKEYVTCNLYVPRNLTGKAPTILYLCGHAINNGGPKVYYQNHPIWFAEHGYICLIMDTIMYGEIGGDEHHSVYYFKQYDLYSRGYTPAGPETWHAMRALDYLCSRPDVDTTRIGATGRSGGGVMTWMLAAADDRVKCAVPTLGTYTFNQQINDQSINENCDCNFWPNICRLSIPEIYGLVAPKPVLVQDATQDVCYPQKGYLEFQTHIAKAYALYGASGNLAKKEYPVPHSETADMRADEFAWFNRWLKNEATQLAPVAQVTYFSATDLSCYPVPASIPADERTSHLETEFIPVANAPAISSQTEWNIYKTKTLDSLRNCCFYHTLNPVLVSVPLQVLQTEPPTDHGTYTTEGFTYQSERNFRCYARLRLPKSVGQPYPVYIYATDYDQKRNLQMEPFLAGLVASGYAVLEVQHRGTIAMIDTLPDQWNMTEEWYILRSSHAIGHSTVAMGVVDLLRAAEVLRADRRFNGNIHICGAYFSAVSSLYAAALDTGIASAALFGLPHSHLFDGKFIPAGGSKLVYSGKMKAPFLMNVLKYCDIPQVLAMVAPRRAVLSGVDPAKFSWAASTYSLLGVPGELIFENASILAKEKGTEKPLDPLFIYPFASHAKIRYIVRAPNKVNVVIYNTFGKQVKTVLDEAKTTGVYETYWDGTDDNGTKVGPGLYIYRMREGQETAAKSAPVIR